MTEPRPTHWTENEETLEQYVLDRLRQDDREILEKHLLGCAPCRERVLAESQLLAGIKQFGRTTLKEKMRNELHTSFIHRVPVQRVLSLAAMLLVVLTVGVLGIWLMRQQTGHPLADQKEIAQTPLSTEPGQAAKPETPPSLAGREREGSGLAQTESRSEPKAEAHAMKKADKQNEISASRPGELPPSASRDAGLSATSPATDSTWIEGEVLHGYAAATEEMQSRAKNMAKDVPSTDRALITPPNPEVTLQLRRTSELPAGRQSEQAAGTADRVVTLLRITPKGLQLTLYLDSRIDQTELQRAHVKVLNDSSVVVEATHLLIRYSLPPGWTAPHTSPVEPTH